MKKESLIIKNFKKEYLRIKPKSSFEYNQEKNASLPCWQTVSQEVGLITWNELLTYCKLHRYPELKIERKFLGGENAIRANQELHELSKEILTKYIKQKNRE